jgi:hypothetical protein
MLAILFNVYQIIDQVDSSCDEAKQCETNDCANERLASKELYVEDKGYEDNAVLCPLGRAHSFEQGA